MALSRIGIRPSLESAEFTYGGRSLLTRLNRPSPVWFVGKNLKSAQRKRLGVQCTLSRKDVAIVGLQGNSQNAQLVSSYEDSGHVVRFKISDFKVLDHVSIGLGGRV